MEEHYLRPSNIGLAMKCSGFLKMSRGCPATDNTYTEGGIRVHKAISCHLEHLLNDDDDALAELKRMKVSPDEQEMLDVAYKYVLDEKINEGEVSTEVSLPQIAGIFAQGGTADVVSLGDETGHIVDWKTGWQRPDPDDLFCQLGSYFLGVLELSDRHAKVNWCVHFVNPRMGWSERMWFANDEVEELRKKLNGIRVLTEVTDCVVLRPGWWCARCPGAWKCPAVERQIVKVEKSEVDRLTIERCQELYLMKKPIEDVLGELRKRIRGFLEDGGESEHFRLVWKNGRKAIDMARVTDLASEFEVLNISSQDLLKEMSLSRTKAIKLLTDKGLPKGEATELVDSYSVEGKKPDPELRRK